MPAQLLEDTRFDVRVRPNFGRRIRMLVSALGIGLGVSDFE
jgi:hypothetical protein